MTTTPHRRSPGRALAGRIFMGRGRLRQVERYFKTKLVWHRVYRAMSYMRSALWISPLVALLAVIALAPLLRALDEIMPWRLLNLAPDGAQALFETVVNLTLSFMVFTFGSLLVAIQVAGGQLTPRIIATTLLRDNVVRGSVGLFVFTLIFAVMALNRLEGRAHQLIVAITVMLGIGCTAMFLFLIDYAARLLRPVSILARIGNEGLKVIDAVYPNRASGRCESHDGERTFGQPARIVYHVGSSAIVLAVDLESLVLEARRAGGLIECIPQVGDFVAFDEPLFALHGGAAGIPDRRLQAAVAFGSERTLEQDPMFALRIMVDIALKALSPAINDPTTGVLAIDQIHRFLRAVGQRELHGAVIADERGTPRLVYRTPDWEDFVHVACSEIRACGAHHLQIARRMRAMLENVRMSLPTHRHAALLDEQQRLDGVIEQAYPIAADLALARVPDSQGLGGSSGARTAYARPPETLPGPPPGSSAGIGRAQDTAQIIAS